MWSKLARFRREKPHANRIANASLALTALIVAYITGGWQAFLIGVWILLAFLIRTTPSSNFRFPAIRMFGGAALCFGVSRVGESAWREDPNIFVPLVIAAAAGGVLTVWGFITALASRAARPLLIVYAAAVLIVLLLSLAIHPFFNQEDRLYWGAELAAIACCFALGGGIAALCAAIPDGIPVRVRLIAFGIAAAIAWVPIRWPMKALHVAGYFNLRPKSDDEVALTRQSLDSMPDWLMGWAFHQTLRAHKNSQHQSEAYSLAILLSEERKTYLNGDLYAEIALDDSFQKDEALDWLVRRDPARAKDVMRQLFAREYPWVRSEFITECFMQDCTQTDFDLLFRIEAYRSMALTEAFRRKRVDLLLHAAKNKIGFQRMAERIADENVADADRVHDTLALMILRSDDPRLRQEAFVHWDPCEHAAPGRSLKLIYKPGAGVTARIPRREDREWRDSARAVLLEGLRDRDVAVRRVAYLRFCDALDNPADLEVQPDAAERDDVALQNGCAILLKVFQK